MGLSEGVNCWSGASQFSDNKAEEGCEELVVFSGPKGVLVGG